LPNCERTWLFSSTSSAPILSVLIPPLWKAMFGSLFEILSPAAWLTAAPNRCRRRRQLNKSVQRQNYPKMSKCPNLHSGPKVACGAL
jgi:hypothetical protein